MKNIMDVEQGEKDICKHCDKEIEWFITPVDNFWSHTHNNAMRCDGRNIFSRTDGTYAEATTEFDHTPIPIPPEMLKHARDLAKPVDTEKTDYNSLYKKD